MKKQRILTLVALVFMFVLPAVVQFGSNSTTTSIELEKTYTESYVHHDQIWIQSDAEFHAQAALESWAGDGSEETPYIITGYLFDCESQPLRIWHTTVHWVFIDNEIFGVGSNIQCGTWIENVTNGAIIGNEVHNRHAGLAIAGVVDFLIEDNYIHDCWGRGIELFGFMNDTIIQDNIIEDIGQSAIYSVTSSGCTIKNNTISETVESSICLLGSNPNCIVTDNTMTHCESAGIIIQDADNGLIADNTIAFCSMQGIFLTASTDCTVTGNIISDIDGYGLQFPGAAFCDISENVIENCTDDGLYLLSGSNTTIEWNSVYNVSGYAVNLGASSTLHSVMYNTFIDNGDTCQVCDDGTSNVIAYNYYDDWDSPDADADGYVDNPYVFEGDAETQDDFPLAEPGVVPTSEVEPTPTGSPMPMELILMAGAVVVIVIVAGLLMLKRR